MRENQVSRRALIGAAIAFPMINSGFFAVHAQTPKKYARRVIDLVRSSLVIDMLGPLSLDFTPKAFSHRMSDKLAADFLASGIGAFHNSVGIGGPDAYAGVLAFLTAWEGYVGRNTHVFELVDKPADMDKAKADGRIAVIMGLQDSDHFRTVKDVETFYQLGQRVSQLTYNTQNLIGSGCTERVDGGLSDYGIAVVEAMNKVGMLVDTSHCGDKTTLDAIEASPVPIAITHSNCRALNNHPRTKTDEAIKALGAKGGMMGVTGVRNFLTATEPTTVANVVDHIEHVAKLIGFDRVGIGSDADLYGYDAMEPEQYKKLKAGYKGSYAFRDKIDTDGFSGPLKVFNLVEEMIRRNHSDEHIRGVLGGNFRRLLDSTWK